MKIAIETDELKSITESVFNGCVRLLALVDSKEGERLRYIEELKKNANGKIITFPSDGGEEEKRNNKGRRVQLKLSNEEADTLPQKLKTKFYAGALKLYAIRRADTGIWEIRKQINGVKFYASGKNKAEAKSRFIERLKDYYELNEVLQPKTKKQPQKHDFCNYAELYLETVKRPTIKEKSYIFYEQVYRAYIKPRFQSKALSDISRQSCQDLINDFVAKGKVRTAQKIKLLLSGIFNFAVQDGLIDKSPMTYVKLPPHEQEHGVALSKEEELKFISDLQSCGCCEAVKSALLVLLYTGIRRSEIAGIKRDGNFISVICAKTRLGYAQRWRNIPITPMLERYINQIDFDLIATVKPQSLTQAVKRLVPQHHCHELRHTFISRCRECGVNAEVVSIWAGHSLGGSITAAVYTHYSKEFMLEEAKKVLY